MSRYTNAVCQFCGRPLALGPMSIDMVDDLGVGATCWICMYATDVYNDARVRISPAVFRRVHAGEIEEAYRDRRDGIRARKLNNLVAALFPDTSIGENLDALAELHGMTE